MKMIIFFECDNCDEIIISKALFNKLIKAIIKNYGSIQTNNIFNQAGFKTNNKVAL